MSTKTNIICSFLLVFSLFSPDIYSKSCMPTESVKCRCNDLPYPQQCLYHLRKESLVINNKREFLRLILKAATTEVARVREIIKRIESSTSHSNMQITREKGSSWSECSNLYDLATVQLNQTLDDYNYHTDSDAQTWLSAVSTNVRICEGEFSPSRGNNNIVQTPSILKNNITALITNSMTINYDWSQKAVDLSIRQHFINKRSVHGNGKKLVSATLLRLKAHITVAKDGSGTYRTVKEAVNHLIRHGPPQNNKRRVIYIKRGQYHERNIVIPAHLTNVVMVGDGIGKTEIIGTQSEHNIGLFQSATLAVYGSGFFTQGMSIRNVADPNNGQAVAVASVSDHSVFYQCSIDSHQDTLFAGSGRQFYRDSFISGTVDFIYGNAAAVFQKCTIKTKPRGIEVITAHGRENPVDNTGYSFHNSWIMPSNNTFLGRPWRDYARTAFINSYFNTNIDKAGWLKFTDLSDINKLCYREYHNRGPGSKTHERVGWNGYRALEYPKDIHEAQQYSVSRLIDGLSWLPRTQVPFDPWV